MIQSLYQYSMKWWLQLKSIYYVDHRELKKKKKRKQLSSYNTPGENNPKTTDIIKRSKEVKSHYIPQVQCPLEKLFFICWPGSLPSPCGNSQKVVIAMKNYKGTESAYGLLGLDIK